MQVETPKPLPHGEGRAPEPSESPGSAAPPAPCLLPVPVACFASVFDRALTRVLPRQALQSPSLLTPTPHHTVASGRGREQEQEGEGAGAVGLGLGRVGRALGEAVSCCTAGASTLALPSGPAL